MRWIIEYWYLIIIGLGAALFFFGYRTQSDREETTGAHGAEQEGEKTHGSDHSCCH